MLEEIHVTEGRAYHKGDVVLLRSKTDLGPDTYAHLSHLLARKSEELGVEFILLGPDIEVVEPREENE